MEFLQKHIHNFLTQLFLKILEESLVGFLVVGIYGEIFGKTSKVISVTLFEGTFETFSDKF